ncbi:phage tail assembly chaperone [Aeromonas caviae]|uniref:phage tail assembly chaperone n=1 Tax=Aeromonas caviae TaxID=648 RepID=UPI0005373940|nr:phage tail assembly chaperone [Aeromonas caviae]PNO60463.1 phage tail protein [Aeromonas caviae]
MTKKYYIDGAFLSSDIHDIPDSAVALTDDEYSDLLKAPSESLELRVIDGKVVKVKPQISESWYRDNRDIELSKTEWIVARHRDELEHLTETTLSTEQYTELQSYRQQLRDWPAQPGWPDIDMPPEPDWLAELKK